MLDEHVMWELSSYFCWRETLPSLPFWLKLQPLWWNWSFWKAPLRKMGWRKGFSSTFWSVPRFLFLFLFTLGVAQMLSWASRRGWHQAEINSYGQKNRRTYSFGMHAGWQVVQQTLEAKFCLRCFFWWCSAPWCLTVSYTDSPKLGFPLPLSVEGLDVTGVSEYKLSSL